MKFRLQQLLSVFVLLISGCATVDPSLLLNRNTKIEIVDSTTYYKVSTGIAAKGDKEAVLIIRKRIMENTKEELAKRNIDAFTEYTEGAAKLKYDIRTLSSGYTVIGTGYGLIGKDKYEIKYKVTLESPDGKKLWDDSDEQDDSDLDDVLSKIASRVAKKVSRYFKDNN